MIRAAILAAAIFIPSLTGAQERGRVSEPVRRGEVRPAQPQDTLPRAPGDTAARAQQGDTLQGGRDAAPRQLIQWSPDDSVMTALLARRGFNVVRYEAGRVSFDAQTRVLSLIGTDSARAGVQRDSTILVADTVAYNDSTKMVVARGDSIILRSSLDGEDIIGRDELLYDVERQEGKTRNFSTIANSGEDWRVMAHSAAFVTDTVAGHHVVYGRDGMITSCLDTLPHYHFLAKELKRVTNNVIVARPAVLYIEDVPVLWLPFIFQDIRSGRRSGMLTPRVQFTDLVRNSPTYRRNIENIGYYFALTDYIDAQASMDWRSGAKATDIDQGFTRFNAELRYRWLNRFMGGSVAASRTSMTDGTRNIALSWSHSQEFSSRTRFNTNMNYVSNTRVQRQNIINPMAAMATIGSQMNLVRSQGPFQVNIGGSRRQYPGRDQVDQDFPSVNITSRPLTSGDWFVLNPSLAFATRQSLNLDATGDFAYRYRDVGGGQIDSTRLSRNTRSTSLSVGTPFKIFNFQVQSGFRFNENENDFPEIRTLVDPTDPTRRIERVYQRTFLSSADFDISLGLPQFLQGTFNVTPSVSASNVDPAGFMVRSERTGGSWVTQSKRLTYGVSVSPTVFRLYPGFGRLERIRHAVSPTLSWGFSPAATVSEEFLNALGKTSAGYLGALAQNRVSLGLSTNIEAKMRAPGDTSDAEAQKVRVASIQFTPLTYDFERKKATGGSGLATDRFGYTFRSDLLPGFDFGVDYSLFQGSVLSDTAVFSPYRESIRASFQLDRSSALVRGVARLFGVSLSATGRSTGDDFLDPMGGGLVSSADENERGMGATTGTRARGAVTEIPAGQGFKAAFTLSSQRQRPPRGGRVIDFDPTVRCAGIPPGPIYDLCVQNERLNPATDNGPNPTTEGATFIRMPPSTSVGVRTSFNLTPNWAAGWSTTYDVERSEFASHIVTLQRELHDWRAVFGFTQAPNGNFAFTFFISLKAQPEIKLDYDRQSYRTPSDQR